jgi:hypothetical protein
VAATKATIQKKKSLEKWIICMSYLWFEWTQDDRLSIICKDAKNVSRENASTSNGKVVVDVK